MHHRLIAPLALTVALACGPTAPPGLDCPGTLRVAADSAELSAALASATAGDCVLLETGRYLGPFSIDQAIGLGGLPAAQAALEAAATETPLTVRAAGATVANLSIVAPSLDAVLVSAAPVHLQDLVLGGARRAGVEIRCEEQGCLMPSARVELSNVSVSASSNGVWTDGVSVRIEGGAIRDCTAQSLSGGIGLIAVGGGRFEVDGTSVSDSDYGMLLDGAGTSAQLDATLISGNRERGVWVQGLRGTVANPSLVLTAGTRLEANHVVGLGSIDSQGLSLRNAQIVDTVLTRISINVVDSAELGDGLGFFAGSGEIEVESTELSGNGRAQALVDTAGANIRFGSNQISGALKVVVQASPIPVTAPAGDLSTVVEALPLVSDRVALP